MVQIQFCPFFFFSSFENSIIIVLPFLDCKVPNQGTRKETAQIYYKAQPMQLLDHQTFKLQREWTRLNWIPKFFKQEKEIIKINHPFLLPINLVLVAYKHFEGIFVLRTWVRRCEVVLRSLWPHDLKTSIWRLINSLVVGSPRLNNFIPGPCWKLNHVLILRISCTRIRTFES